MLFEFLLLGLTFHFLHDLQDRQQSEVMRHKTGKSLSHVRDTEKSLQFLLLL